MTSHTPGPWSLVQSPCGKDIVGMSKAPESYTIVTGLGRCCSKADELLLASCPELLEALIETVVGLYACDTDGQYTAEIINAREIIKKATGRQIP